jgi:PIN domain nuclease of toxin-antitoxin system
MKILLDTCTFLWLILGADDLSDRAKKLFVDPGNDVYIPQQRERHRIRSLR